VLEAPRIQNGHGIPEFGAVEMLGVASFGAYRERCCVRNFSSPFFRFRAAFPSGFLLFAMLAKHLTTQCESYMRSSTASILANGAIRIYLNVFSAESSLTNYLSSNKPDHVDKTDRSFFDDSHLRTQHQRAHVEGSQWHLEANARCPLFANRSFAVTASHELPPCQIKLKQ
jgi:hypothetical protein